MILTLPMLASLSLALPDPGKQTYDAIVFAASSASEASMHLELFIAPDRRILTCRMLHVRPNDAPVERVCGKLTGRRVARAARGADGRPMHAVSNFVFTLDRVAGYNPPPELRIEVTGLPANATQETVRVRLAVDETGIVTSCHEQSAETKALADLACSRVTGSRKEQRRGRNGEPVAYLDGAFVELVEATSSQ